MYLVTASQYRGSSLSFGARHLIGQIAYGHASSQRLYWLSLETLPALISNPASDVIERLKALVLDSVNSPESKRAYDRAITDFLLWCSTAAPGTGFTKATVQAYRAQLIEQALSSSTINVRMSAIRRLSAEAADNGLMAPELAAGIGRVKGIKQEGVRSGNWLTVHQSDICVS